MKPLASEISDFEKGLSSGSGLEQSIDSLFYGLNSCVVDKDKEAFRGIWEAWVNDLPENDQELGLLADIRFKYPGSEERENFPTYLDSFFPCLMQAVAAQRAFDRKDTDAAWPLVIKANRYWLNLEIKHEYVLWKKLKLKKGKQAAKNGGVKGQRVRYQVVMLLHQAHEKRTSGFKDLSAALNAINHEIAAYLDENFSEDYYGNLKPNMERWIEGEPAFRAALKQFFVKGWMEETPVVESKPGQEQTN